MRRILSLLVLIAVCANPGAANAQKHKKGKKAVTPVDNSAAPDKTLYGRAIDDVKRGKHEVGRLTLQTLINTYPDSDYLAKAKLAIADSYLKEGGTANLAQAIAGYKDFIVFFPFLEEAPYAQLQVAMAHYKQVEKPDRDRTHARAAQDELQTFLQKYPNDPLAPKAEQRLREVQEVLAEGDFRIGAFYFTRQSYRASAGRLLSVANRYPLYSRTDRALWLLGSIFEKSERKDLAANYYARIVRNYPLSGMADDAKKKLAALNAPIPQPDPQALARMQQEQAADHRGPRVLGKMTGILKSGPNVKMAATAGKPNMEPESAASGVDILTPGSGQNTVVGSASTSAGTVATVAAGSGEAGPVTEPPAAGDTTGAAPAAGDPAASGSAPGTDPAAGTDPKVADPQADPAKAAQNKASPADKKKESTSRKKKGLKKIIPW